MQQTTVSKQRHSTSIRKDYKAKRIALDPHELRPTDKILSVNAEELSVKNLHVGDNSNYALARLTSEGVEYLRDRMQKNRNPQYTPTAHDSVERLSCLAGMANSRTDIFEMETAFVLLCRRFMSATMPAERIFILEAMYHACGYEGHLFYSDLKRRCDKLYDEHIPAELATFRLQFYRHCPSLLVKSIGRDAGCKRWLNTLKSWMNTLAESKNGYWEDLPLVTNFLRQRYIYRTGCRYLTDGDKEQTEYYRNMVYNCFFDCLLKLQKSTVTDIPTLVAAYHALREFKNSILENEQRYKVFMSKVNILQTSLPKSGTKWLQLEELKLDYEANNNKFALRFVVK